MKRIGNINGKVVVLGTHNCTTSKYIEITSELLKKMNTLGTWEVETTSTKEQEEVLEDVTTETPKITKETKSKKKVLTEEDLGL